MLFFVAVHHAYTVNLFSSGGFILSSVVSQYPGIAVYSPVINGVGGNLVAIQASRTSTSLHTSGCPVGSLLEAHASYSSLWKAFSPGKFLQCDSVVDSFMFILQATRQTTNALRRPHRSQIESC